MRLRMLREFIHLEASAGIILFIAALSALILDNTSFHTYYRMLLTTQLSINLGLLHLSKPLLLWINDGFMAIFFLLVGLEIKREMLVGELSTLAKSMLPAIAAVGGMLFPALIYLAFNRHGGMTL